jgi:hypothetical protein
MYNVIKKAFNHTARVMHKQWHIMLKKHDNHEQSAKDELDKIVHDYGENIKKYVPRESNILGRLHHRFTKQNIFEEDKNVLSVGGRRRRRRCTRRRRSYFPRRRTRYY